MAGTPVAEQQNVDALVVLDLVRQRPRVITLRLDQGDDVLWLRVRRDGMNRRPDADRSDSSQQQDDDERRRQRQAQGGTHRTKRSGCAPPALLCDQLEIVSLSK